MQSLLGNPDLEISEVEGSPFNMGLGLDCMIAEVNPIR